MFQQCYHIMRDNIHHNWVMMAGLWGGCNKWQGAVGTEVAQKALCVPSHDQTFLKVSIGLGEGGRGLIAHPYNHNFGQH